MLFVLLSFKTDFLKLVKEFFEEEVEEEEVIISSTKKDLSTEKNKKSSEIEEKIDKSRIVKEEPEVNEELPDEDEEDFVIEFDDEK